MFDNQLNHLMTWMFYAMTKLILHSSRAKYNHVDTHVRSWTLKTIIRSTISKVMALIVFATLELILVFCAYGPVPGSRFSVYDSRATAVPTKMPVRIT